MIYAFGPYELDIRRYELRQGETTLSIEPQVFEVLAHLVQNRDRVVTKQELLDHVWSDRFVSEATLSSRLMAARKAIGDSGRAQRLIKTVHGRGFRFIGEVDERSSAMEPERRGAAGSGCKPGKPLIPVADDGSLAVAADSPLARPAVPWRTSDERKAGPAFGRTQELEALQRWLDDADRGVRRIVFITGEAGLGKTTLVDQFISRCQSASTSFTLGQCLEHRGSAEAYMPVLEALGRLCGASTDSGLVELLALHAPSWLIQMPWLVDHAQLEELRQRTEDTSRERMLREMLGTLELLTVEQTVVLVLEDLHWSDVSTLDLLALIARRREPARLLVLGTYRPPDVLASGHPLHDTVQELVLRGHAEELRLGYLPNAAIEELISSRFPGATFVSGLASILQQRTDGNPLFMENVLDTWVVDGSIVLDNGAWTLQTRFEDLGVGMPETLRQFIEQQIERTSEQDQRILEAASVAGREFASAAVAAATESGDDDVESRCATLSRQGRFLRSVGSIEWPDGTISEGFGFIHDLYPQVLYDRIPAGRRARFHARIGLRLEQAWTTGSGRADLHTHAAELAIHFVRGRNAERAVQYSRLAAEQAIRRGAHREAIEQITAALELTDTMAESPERDQAELALQALLGSTLIATRGWSDEAAEHALLRAREICYNIADPMHTSQVLYGLATMYEYRGDYKKAQVLAEERLALLPQPPDKTLVLETHELLACSLYHQGFFSDSLSKAELGLAAHDPRQKSSDREAHALLCDSWAALAQWFLGNSNGALARMYEILRLAQEVGDALGIATARVRVSYLHQLRREPEAALDHADAALALAGPLGLVYHIAMSKVLRGWALSMSANPGGITLLEEGLREGRSIGSEMDSPYFLALLGEGCLALGRSAAGLEAVREALSMIRGSRSFFYEAEIHRLEGELLLQEGTQPERAERSLREAVTIARAQQARSLELRAATSLAQLWLDSKRADEAAELLRQSISHFSDRHESAPELLGAQRLLARAAGEAEPA